MCTYYRRGTRHACVVVGVELMASWNYCCRGTRHGCVVVSVELLMLWSYCRRGTKHVCVFVWGGTDVVVEILLSWN